LNRTQNALVSVGQVIKHKLFNYRGVVIDVDPVFMQSEDWYEALAISRPPKDEPWYRVLVHNATHETYVAQRNLEPDDSNEPINHPDIDLYFKEFVDGCYRSNIKGN